MAFLKNYLKYKPKRGISMYLICLVIAILSWGSLKLSKEYLFQLTFKIHYTNIPNQFLISESSDSVVTINLKKTGFNILSDQAEYSNSVLTIDASKSVLRAGNRMVISSSVILEALKFQKKIIGIESLSLDSISLHYTQKISKKVPVISLVTFSAKKQYFMSDSAFVTPDSVWISGCADDIKSIQYVNTKIVHLTELDRSYITDFSLFNTTKTKLPIEIKPSSVAYFLPIERYTESSVDCKINTVTSNGNEIKTFPGYVSITFYVAVSQFKNIVDTNFSVSLDLTKTLDENKAMVSITKKPKHIKIVKITPEAVEFLRVKP